MTKTRLVGETVVHAWVVLNETQFDKHCLGDFCPNMGFNFENALITLNETVDAALFFAKTYHPKERVYICLMGFDNLTCVNSINAALSGNTMDIQAVCKEYFQYPSHD